MFEHESQNDCSDDLYHRVNAHLSQLLECSIVSRGVHHHLYGMHRLIQATVLDRLNDDTKMKVFHTALNAVIRTSQITMIVIDYLILGVHAGKLCHMSSDSWI